MSSLTKAERAMAAGGKGLTPLAYIEVLEAEVARLTREVDEAQRELERRGRAVSDAMGKYRRHEPLIEAVGRLANEYHNAMVQVEHLTARAEALEAVVALARKQFDASPWGDLGGLTLEEYSELKVALQRLQEEKP